MAPIFSIARSTTTSKRHHRPTAALTPTWADLAEAVVVGTSVGYIAYVTTAVVARVVAEVLGALR
ncbi:hypothetical protein MN608_04176 [Microdochium nivale]|nr:hypothetical protein MN608_04176 [Microdochium nivale]